MALNPNIIANAMSNITAGMPDASNLMAQRVQGMENIYKIETARQAAAEEEAAALKKEQEAAAIKALLPAYTYGIQTGDISGAGNLVPQEMRGQLQPFIDALTGKSPQEVQAALIGSLASSPEGQEALTAIQRAETASIQRGQLDVSRGNLDLDRQKAALDARGEGEWELKEGEGSFFWTNPRTREVIRAGVTGGAVPSVAAVSEPGVVTPRAPAPGAPAVEAPIGTQQPPQEFKPKPKSPEKLSENERLAAFNAGRTLLSAADIFSSMAEDPDAVAPGALEAGVGLFMDPNFIRSENRQVVNSAQYEAIDAILTLATGAAYNQEQREAQIQRYVPLYSDKEKNRDAKKRALLNIIKTAKVKSGAAWTPEMDAALEKLGLLEDASAGAPPAAAPDTTGFSIRNVREK